MAALAAADALEWEGALAARAPPRATGCAARAIRSRAAPAKCSSTSSPSASSTCREPERCHAAAERRTAMLRDSARSFLAENAPVAQLRKLRDSRDPAGFAGSTCGALRRAGLRRRAGARGARRRRAGRGRGGRADGADRPHAERPRPSCPAAWSRRGCCRPPAAPRSSALAAAHRRAARPSPRWPWTKRPKHRPRSHRTAAERDGDGWRLDGQQELRARRPRRRSR